MAEKRDLENHEHIDDGLKMAFGEGSGSVLDRIESISGKRSRILLRDAPEDASPMLRVPGPQEAGDVADDSRYQIIGEIARGGVGVVYKGRDKDLGRDVALKVLRAEFAEAGPVIQRFIEEAQVGAQLQHPGIVPIYGLGLQEDGNPYFAMKLIKGETLTALIERGEKSSVLIGVFERIAQTMAYAHDRGVIHRDLKPANVMVGAFGEAQVVDWGFAKVLGRPDTARQHGDTMVATVRSGGEGSQSMVGSVMGTPGYMPPEQAMGQVDELNERADVFSLGAILCEILTRQPPYTGTMQDQLLAAAQARLDEAHARISECNAPEPIKQLARDCMAPLPKDRPANAGVVAQRLADHLASVEERARQSELDAVHAAAETRKSERAKRTTIALAAVALLALAGGGFGYTAWNRAEKRRIETANAQVTPLLRDATRLEGDEKWAAATAAATNAITLAETGGADADTLAGARMLRDRIGSKAAAANELVKKLASEENLIDTLDELVMEGIDLSVEQQDTRYARAFDNFGVDPEGSSAARSFAGFSRSIDLAIHLDRWARIRREALKADGSRLDALARALDPDVWRNRVRDAVLLDDKGGRRRALRTLARSDDLLEQQPSTLVWLSRALRNNDEAALAADTLRRACVRHPDDFWIHYTLAFTLGWHLDRAAEAEPHVRAALALRPRSAATWNTLGAIWAIQGRDSQTAIRWYEKAIALNPRLVVAHNNLGKDLRLLRRYDEAIEAIEEALRIDPKNVMAHGRIASVFLDQGDLKAALASAESALRLDPNHSYAHNTIGLVRHKRGDFDGAIEAFREALRIEPKHGDARCNLAESLLAKGDLKGAIAAYRMALEIDPELVLANLNYGSLLAFNLRKPDEALVYIRKAIALDPDQPAAHLNLGQILWMTGDLKGAEAAHKKAVEIGPDTPQILVNYGAFLVDALRRFDDAIVQFRAALKIQPNNFRARRCLGIAYHQKGNLKSAIAEFKKAARLQPKHAGIRLQLADLSSRTKDYASAARFWDEAFRIDPALVSDLRTGHRYNAACAAALAGKEWHEQAFAWLRADLDAWRNQSADVAETMRHWQKDSDLASVRDVEGLSAEWQKLWADVDALLRKVSK